MKVGFFGIMYLEPLPRRVVLKEIRRSSFGQINFDGKLLNDLSGFRKINRLAVVVVQKLENHILGIVKTANATLQQVNSCDFSALIAALNADEFMNDY